MMLGMLFEESENDFEIAEMLIDETFYYFFN